MRVVGGRHVLVVLALVAGALVAAVSTSAVAQAPECFGEAATIVAEPGVPTVGTSGDDVIVGTAGPDRIRGRGGDDLICGLAGADVIRGNAGRDRINAGSGADKVFGGKGRDVIVGSSGADVLSGNSGADTIRGNKGRDEISGGSGDDTIAGGNQGDEISGDGGADTISGGKGDDTIAGGRQGDVLRGQSGLDTLLGNSGPDVLRGGTGFDVCRGGSGKDRVSSSCDTALATSTVARVASGKEPSELVRLDMVVPADDRPLIGMYDAIVRTGEAGQSLDGALRFVRCNGRSCRSVSASSRELADVVNGPSLTFGADGVPVVGYAQHTITPPNTERAWSASLLACDDPVCAGFTETVIPSMESASVAAAADGTTYLTGKPPFGDPAFTHPEFGVYSCADPMCPGGPTEAAVEGTGWGPGFPQVEIGADGLPVIAQSGQYQVLVQECLDAGCLVTEPTMLRYTIEDTGGDVFDAEFQVVESDVGFAVGEDGPAAAGYTLASGLLPREVGRYLEVWDEEPAGATRIVLEEYTATGSGDDPGASPFASGILGVVVGSDGRPLAIWRQARTDVPARPVDLSQGWPSEVVVARCDDRSCETGTLAIVARGPLQAVSVAVGPDGRPVLALVVGSGRRDPRRGVFVDQSEVVVSRCRDAGCVKGAYDVETWDIS